LGQIFFADALTFMETVSFWPSSRSPARGRTRLTPAVYLDR